MSNRWGKSQNQSFITTKTSAEWTCWIPCVGRCLQRQVVDDGRLLSSGTYWTAGINAWILFRIGLTTNAQISRRQFLRQLSAELRETSTSSGSTPAPASTSSSSTTTQLGKRVNCRVKVVCKRNRTSTLCGSCKRPVCGQCMVNICKQCNA